MAATRSSSPHFSIRSWPYRSIIPNGITVCGLLLSFLAIIFILQENYVSASWFIFFTCVLDVLDGPAARLFDAFSNLGKELDSFADLVNCGLASSLLVYQVFLKDWGIFGLGLSFSLLAFVAIRLGRFNTAAVHKPDYYTGLPVPAVANLISGYVIFCDGVWGQYRFPALAAVIIPVLCWLMVSNLRYPKSYFLLPQRIFRTWQGVGALMLILAVTLFPTWIFLMPLIFIVGVTALGFLPPKVIP